jgi:hypothetical protein
VRKRLILVVAAVALAAAGCTTSDPGQPTSTANGSSTDSSAPQTSDSPDAPTPTVEIPPRPRDISLEGLDPCTLYTEEQRAQLQANEVESGESEADFFKGMKECALYVDDQEPFYEYSAMAVTFEGVEAWLTGKRNADAELASVQGFPAARFKFRGVEDEGCWIAVGVADKQYLVVQMQPTSRGFTQEKICQMALDATNMALTTLQTLR